MTPSTVISLKNVTKKYAIGGDTIFTALDGIDLEIKKGEYAAIVGPSGSGKSTLMHVIGLLDKPSSGEVIIQDKNVANLNDDDIRVRRLCVPTI